MLQSRILLVKLQLTMTMQVSGVALEQRGHVGRPSQGTGWIDGTKIAVELQQRHVVFRKAILALE